MNVCSSGDAGPSSVASTDEDALAKLKALARALGFEEPAGNELTKVLDEQYRQAILGGDPDQACQAAIEMARMRVPDDARAALRLLNAVYATGRPPHDLDARYEEALLRRQVGDNDGAYRCLTDVTEGSQALVATAVWYTRGQWLQDDSHYSEAEKAFLEVVTAGPSQFYGSAALGLSGLRGRNKDWAAARRWAMEASRDSNLKVAWGGAKLVAAASAIQRSPIGEDLDLFHELLASAGTDHKEEDVRVAAATALLVEAQSLLSRGAKAEALEIFDLIVGRFTEEGSNERMAEIVATASLQQGATKEPPERSNE